MEANRDVELELTALERRLDEVVRESRRRERRHRITLLLLGAPFLVAATVTVKNADLLIDRNGSNSYDIKLRGNDGAADRDVSVRNVAGGGTYRLGVYDNSGATELWTVTKDGDSTLTRNLNVNGDVTLGDGAGDAIKTRGKLNRVVVVDGTAEPSIQNALNALPASGGTVFIPEGTYVITSALTLPAGRNNVTIQGAGRGTIIQSASTAANLLYVDSGRTGIVVRDLFLRYSVAPTAGGQRGVHFQGGIDCVVTGCWFENCYYGVAAIGDATYAVRRLIVSGNQFVSCSYGVWFFGTNASYYVQRCKVSDNVMEMGGAGWFGIMIEFANVTSITGNVVNDPGSYGIWNSLSVRTTVSGNSVSSSGSSGIRNASSPYATISGNSIQDSGSDGIQNDSSSDVAITGNAVYNSATSGIANSGAVVTISGNTVRIAGSFGVYSGSSRCVISSNTIESAAGDGIYNNWGTYASISGNVVYAPGGMGIHNEGAVVSITGNSISWAGTYGIYNQYGDEVAIGSNVVYYPGAMGICSDGEWFDYSARVDIDGNTIIGSTKAIWADYSWRAKIDGNMIDGCSQQGIYGENQEFMTVSNNTVLMGNAGWRAIELAGGTRYAVVSGNQTYSGWDGIFVNSDAPLVTGNHTIAAGASCIYFGGNQGTCTGNRADSGVWYGLYGWGSDSTYTGNVCRWNGTQFYLWGSNNQITGNHMGWAGVTDVGAGNWYANNR